LDIWDTPKGRKSYLWFLRCGQTVRRIKMKLGMQVGLGPDHIVSAPLPKRGTAPFPQFPAHI